MPHAKRLRQLTSLQKTLRGFGGLAEKLKIVTDGIIKIFHADYCRIWVLRPADLCESGCLYNKYGEGSSPCSDRKKCLHLYASSGRCVHIDGDQQRIPLSHSLIGRLATMREKLCLTNDVSRAKELEDHPWAGELGMRAFAGYRLEDTAGEPIGVMALFSKKVFSPEEFALLEGLAISTAQIIQVKRAVQEKATTIHYLESMNKISRIFDQTLDMEKALQQIVESLLHILNCSRAWLIHPCDPQISSFRVFCESARPDYPGAYAANAHIPMTANSEKVFMEVLATHEPVTYINHLESMDDSLPETQMAKKFLIRSQMGIALRPPVEKPWMLGLHHCSYERQWTDEEKRLFKDISLKLTDGLTNMLLHRDLKISERKYSSLFKNSHDGIYRCDMEGRFTDVNPALIRLLGLKNKKELLKKKITDYKKEENSKKPFAFPDKITLHNEAAIWIETRSWPIRDEEGKISGYEGIVRDQTEQKMTEELLLHTQKQESMGILAGGIAHDFNNLLVGIVGNADLLSEELSHSPSKDHVDEILLSARRATELSMAMLAYSGKGKFFSQPLDLSQVIEEIIHLLDVSVSKNVVIKYHLNKTLPTIKGDASQLRQLIMNLVVNASEAIGAKRGVISISTKVVNKKDVVYKKNLVNRPLEEEYYVSLSVTDTGSGIAEKTGSKIFDPFFTTKFMGRGLGLSVVHGIVRGHDGVIDVSSKADKGSQFVIYFPCSGAHLEEPEEPFQHQSQESRGKGKILIVDDETVVCHVVERMLVKSGFSVVTAFDGVEAIKRFKDEKESIKLVLTDLTMPRKDGETTYKELRKIRPDIPVILMSGYSEKELANRFSDLGISGFIQKPFHLNTLVEKVLSVLP